MPGERIVPRAFAIQASTLPRRLAAAPVDRVTPDLASNPLAFLMDAGGGSRQQRPQPERHRAVSCRRPRSRDRRGLPPHPRLRRRRSTRWRLPAPRTRTSRWSGRRRCGTSGRSRSARHPATLHASGPRAARPLRLDRDRFLRRHSRRLLQSGDMGIETDDEASRRPGRAAARAGRSRLGPRHLRPRARPPAASATSRAPPIPTRPTTIAPTRAAEGRS